METSNASALENSGSFDRTRSINNMELEFVLFVVFDELESFKKESTLSHTCSETYNE